MCVYELEEGLFDGRPRFLWMYDYLVSIARPGELPRRQDLDPPEMRHLLNAINLMDLVPDGDDFRLRYRLVGTLQCYFFANGKDPKGRYLDEFWGKDPAVWDTLKVEYRDAIATRAPVLSHIRKPQRHRAEMVFQRALFPLGSDGENVDCFLGVHHYQNREERQGLHGAALGPGSFQPVDGRPFVMEPVGVRHLAEAGAATG